MKVHEETVVGARLGGRAEFEEIVRAYEKGLYAFALASTRNGADAEDAVQDVFAKVVASLRDLREPGRFEAWLWQVARNVLSSRARALRSAPGSVDLDPDEVAGPERPSESPGVQDDEAWLLGPLFARLSAEEAMAAALRYGGDFSVREIALTCAVPESTAKSRLDTARRRMRAGAAAGGRASREPAVHRFRIPFGLEERIMDNLETLRLGAAVIERLSNEDQMRLAIFARKGEAFDEGLLAALGRVGFAYGPAGGADRGSDAPSQAGDASGRAQGGAGKPGAGAEFVRRVGARLSIKEFASMLNYADRYTEKRIVEGLESVDDETSEEIKRNMFVFEDFVLFDERALGLLCDEVGEEVFAVALAACGTPARDEILGRLASGRAEALRRAMTKASWSPESARVAQEEAVAFARKLDQSGRLRVLRGDGYPRGFLFTVP